MVAGGFRSAPAPAPAGIRLASPAGWAWLDAPTTTRFAYPLADPTVGYSVGGMTVRKERHQRGGAYWTVYRRVGGRVRKVYLGRSAAVTPARLEAITQALLAEDRVRKEEPRMDGS